MACHKNLLHDLLLIKLTFSSEWFSNYYILAVSKMYNYKPVVFVCVNKQLTG